MDISVIIPVFNKQSSLRRCVESILQATDLIYEIILIDDGSEDESLIICKNLEKKYRCVHTYTQKNTGVSSARNLGLENAKGNFVAFVDADDYVDNNFWRNIEEVLKYHVDLSVFGMTRLDANGKKNVEHISVKKEIVLDIREIYSAIFSLERSILSCCTMLYSRKKIEKYQIRFQSGMRNCEDFLFNIKYIERCTSVYVSGGESYYYVNNPESVTMNRPLSHADDDELIYKELQAFSERHNIEVSELYYRRWTRWMIDLVANWREQMIPDSTIWNKLENNTIYIDLMKRGSVGVQEKIERYLLREKCAAGIKYYIDIIGYIKRNQ